MGMHAIFLWHIKVTHMKRLFLNIICILIIGVGGLTLATTSPASSLDVDSSAVIKVNAECETDSGDTCEGGMLHCLK